MRAILQAAAKAVAVSAVLGISGVAGAAEADAPPRARSYLALPLDASGEPAALPYVWERRVGRKHVAVIGTRHLFDPSAAIYPRIEAAFERVRPQIVLHESEAPPGLATMPRDEAIRAGADLGFAVHLAGRLGVPARSADASPAEEIDALLARYPARDVLVFLTAQRLIGSGRAPDLEAAAAGYPDFYSGYLVANGLPARTEWKDWSGFKVVYEHVTGMPLSPQAWDRDRFSPIRRGGHLSDMARETNVVRDRRLLAQIRAALGEHDRVVVVFGSWHVLALEPVLDRVFEN